MYNASCVPRTTNFFYSVKKVRSLYVECSGGVAVCVVY